MRGTPDKLPHAPNLLKPHRAKLDAAIKKALDEMERCWEQDSTGAKPVKFSFKMKVRLADGDKIKCWPEGKL